MCDCFHLAFPNWHAASSGTGAGRRLRGPEPGTEDDSICDEPSQFTEGERPRPQGSSPVEEYPEKYSDSDKECEAEHAPHYESGSGKKTKKSGLGSMFEKRSTPKMSKLKEVPSPESGVIVKTAKDGCAEGLVYGGGGKDGIFIKQVVPESPASKSLKLKEGDQILSATVYFDNMSYEDAIQILEHAQAYKVKLCLKRQPDITETEPAIKSDVIPEEEEVCTPEMREQGKTKRRGDARISWPKFPSFGKGKKSSFARSHSSSEADEQRKLELSPTTSDTESPIKSQDALKGKKKQKIKLSGLKKKGRTSSSEDQETPTTGQVSGNTVETHVASPECLESPPGETPGVFVSEDLKLVEDLRQDDQKLTEQQTVQHKVELITIDSTLKTADLSVALADKESSSPIKSPDGKKKKKERSELKMKILGKDKSQKKDTKAKSSPKRLKTLGASIEIPDQTEKEKSEITASLSSHTTLQGDQLAPSTTQIEMSVPKVELDISDEALIRKSSQKGEEKMKKGKDSKQKQETKTGATFKLPKIGLRDINTEETIQEMNVNVEGGTTKIEQITSVGTGVKVDPYEQLSKSSLSRTQLPKREEIEIPGMEDKSKRSKAKGFKEPKAGFTGQYEELQAETVQLSIDVESVKEAVSKLPGYKLPKVDMSGMPIPEEITVIDANAQRISVKTPTKVVDTKTKHEADFTNIDVTASPEISKTTVKLPKITVGLTSEEFLTETKVDLKTTETKYKTEKKQSGTEIITEFYKREDIIIPGKESEKKQDMAGFGITKPNIKVPEIGIHLADQNISQQIGERTIFIPEVQTSKTETSKDKVLIGGVTSDVKIHETDGIEYIDSADYSLGRKDGGITGFGVTLDATRPNTDISIPEIRGELKDVDAEEHTIKMPKFGAVGADISVNVPDAAKVINIDRAEIKTFERDGKGSKFELPNLDISIPKVKGPKIDSSLSKKDADVTLPEAKEEIKVQEVPQVNISLGNLDISIPEEKMEVKKPELEIRPLQTDGEQGSKLAITMPRVKGPEVDMRFSKKDGDVPGAEAKIKIPEEASISVDTKQLQSEAEMDVQGSKFKMPKLGITIPKVKGPAIDFSVSKKDVDSIQPEVKAEVKLPDDELKEPSAKVEIKAPEIKDTEKDREGSPLKFKLPTFKLPKLGVATPNISDEGSNKTKAIQIPETKLKPPKEGVVVDIQTPSTDIKDPSIDVKTTAAELNEKGSKFKMSKFDISLPKVKGPEIDLSLSKKEVDVTLPEAKAEVKLPDVEPTELGVKVEVKAPEFEVRKQDVEGSPSKYKMPTFKLPKFGVGLPDSSVKAHDTDKDLKVEGDDIKIPEKGFSVNVAAPSIDTESASIEMKTTGTEEDEKGSKFKMPNLGFSMPKVKGPKIDLSLSKKDTDVALPEADLGNVDVEIPEAKMEIPEAKAKVKLPEAPKIALEMEPPQSEAGIGGHGGKFKTPKFGIKMPKIKGPEFDLSLSKKDVDVKLPETEVDVKLPEVDLDKVGVSIPQAKMEVKKPELEMQSLQIEGELDERGERFKIPKFGMKMPKVKGPEFDLSFSKKDMDVTVPEAKFEGKLPDTPKMHVSVGKAEVLIPEAKAAVEKPELKIKPLHTEAEGQGSKFKMPKFGMGMPRVKGPEFHLGFSKTDADVTGPEAKADVNLPDVEVKEPSIKAPEFEVVGKDTDGLHSTFRMPSINVSLPKVKESDVHLGLSKKDTDITLPAAEVKLPGAPKIDTRLGKAEVLIPETKVEVKKPEMEIKPLQADVELEGKGGKFKMPKFGITMPKVKGPEIDLSFSKKDTDVKLPEAKAEAEIPEAPEISMEMKPPQAEADIGGQGSKFKVPKFGISLPKVKGPDINVGLSKKDIHARLPDTKAEVKLPVAPEIDVNLEKVDTTIPDAKIEVKKPELEIKPLKSEGEIDGQGGKFQMPKFGISVPKVKGPEIGISSSKEESEITLPEIKTDISLPDVELKEPSAKVEIKAPKIEAQLPSVKGSPSKFKMPTFKFPKFGAATANVSTEVPDTDKEIKTDGADMHISVPHTDVDGPEIKAQVHVPEVEVKELSGGDVVMEQPGVEVDAKMKKPRFSLPKFSFSKPSVKAPEVDVSLPDVNVAIPEGKVEEKGEVDVKPSVFETEVDGQGSKFKMPKFGITMPKIKGPEIDLSFSKKEIDVEIPEARAEGKIPDLELKEPSAEVEIKAPDIKLNAADIKIPEPLEGDVEIDGQGSKVPKEGATVDVTVPSIDTDGLSVELKAKGGELEGSGGRFKMPKFGISMPKVKGPEINLSLSKKDVDVTLPEAKAEVTLPDVELKEPSAEVEVKAPEIKVATKSKEGSPLKFKMPTFSLPKFGGGTPSATPEVPETDKDVKIKGVDVKIPEEVLTVAIAAPGSDTEGLSIDMKTTETEGKGSKFKMPSLGFSAPQVKQPDIDLSLSKKDVDVKLPEVKAEVQLTDAKLEESSAKMEIKAPETDVQISTVEGSPSKFKMPTFKLPKFGAATPQVSVEVPDVDKDITVDGASLTLPQTTVEAKLPDVELKEPVGSISVSQAPVTEGDAKLKKTRFTLPKFSFSKQSAKEPEVDLSLPDARVSLPEAHVEVKQPEVELKPSEVDAEIDGQGSKFKIPKFGVSMPKVKGPKIDLSLSKKDEDVNLSEAKAEVQLPDVHIKGPSGKVEITAPEVETKEVNVKGSPSKLKMPTFTLPKFGAATPAVSVEVPDVDKDIKFDRAEMKVPKEGATVDVTVPNVDTDGLSVEVKAKESELEGSGSKFKIPKFGISMPKVKGPEIDLSLSKKDVDKTLPEAKAEVKIPDVKLKESSAKVEIKAPEVDVQTSNIEESPSKFKMPSFKLPKFGAATPQVSVEVPDVDKDIKVDGANLTLPQTKAEVKLPDINLKESSAEVEVKAPEIKVETKKTEGSPLKFKMPTFSLPKFGGGTPSVTPEVPKTDKDVKIKGPDVKIPEEVLTVAIAAPGSDTEGLSIDMKTTETEGKGSKFKMPSFGFSAPQVKQPDTDLSLSKKDVDVALPEVKAEVKLPDVKVKEPSVDVKASEVDVQTSTVEGSPSKFKMPSFKLPKFGAGTPQVSVEVPDVDKDIKVDEAKLKSPKTKVEAKLPEVEIKEPESDAKLSKTKFSLSKFSFSKQSAKEMEVDVSLPDAEVSLPGGNVKVKQPEVELKPSEGDVEIDGQGSKFKFPKFGVSIPKTKEQKDVDVTLPEVKAEVQLPDVKIKGKSTKVEIKSETETKTGDVEGSPSKLKMPTFSFPKFGATTPKVSVEVPDVDKDIKVDGSADVTSPSVDTEDVKAKGSKFKMLKFGISTPTELPEAKAEVKLPSVEVKQSVDEMSVPDASEVDTEAKLKQRNWTFPKFSFSKTSGNAPDADVNLETSTKVDVTSPKAKAEADVKVQGPSGTISVEEQPATDLDANLKKTKFSLPRFSLSKSSVKEPEVSAELPHVDVSLPEGNVVVKQPEMEIKAPETDAEHDVQVSRFKFPKFGITTPKAKGPEGDSNASQKEVGIALPEVKVEVTLPEVEVKTSANKEIKASETEAESKEAITDTDMPKTETDGVGQGSPSKFKMPSFKMPKLSFTRTKPEDENIPVETESKENQQEVEAELKGETKSAKMTLTSFGEILRNIDVEFDVSNTDKDEKDPEPSKEVHETDEPSEKQLESKKKETKQDTIKSPERTGWFKFPKFGLSSPSEPAKAPEKDEHKDEKSPVDVSQTGSVQSSDAFADISSAVTSEHAGLSLSSPTKVTVKYSGPDIDIGLGEVQSNIITSTARTELISVEPNLPEKITIQSSGVSSSSEDTLKLESGKIHVITSNIQATPESQQANLLTSVQERHLIRETSSGRSENKETIVITKQITHVFDSSEPISGETASSIQRLKDSVHSEKMRFFGGTKK